MSAYSESQAMEIVRRLGLTPLPVEGGLFRQTWRNDVDNGVIGTATIAALTNDPDSFSAMHQLSADELWHFYAGDPVDMLLLHQNGTWTAPTLGNDLLADHQPQIVVPAGTWMGARLSVGGVFALFGNTMSPGFSSERYKGGRLDDLVGRWPSAVDLIRTLVRPDGRIDMPPGL